MFGGFTEVRLAAKLHPGTMLLTVAPPAPHRSRVALMSALVWAAVFIAAHGYWYVGGRLGLGDAPNTLPGAPNGLIGWIFTVSVAVLFLAGLLVPAFLLWNVDPRVPQRLLVALLSAGCAVLVARGGLGLLDDLIRDVGLSDGGLTGLSYQQTLGIAHPSAYTLWSTAAIDAYFFLGGPVFGWAARQRVSGTSNESVRSHRA